MLPNKVSTRGRRAWWTYAGHRVVYVMATTYEEALESCRVKGYEPFPSLLKPMVAEPEDQKKKRKRGLLAPRGGYKL